VVLFRREPVEEIGDGDLWLDVRCRRPDEGVVRTAGVGRWLSVAGQGRGASVRGVGGIGNAARIPTCRHAKVLLGQDEEVGCSSPTKGLTKT